MAGSRGRGLGRQQPRGDGSGPVRQPPRHGRGEGMRGHRQPVHTERLGVCHLGPNLRGRVADDALPHQRACRGGGRRGSRARLGCGPLRAGGLVRRLPPERLRARPFVGACRPARHHGRLSGRGAPRTARDGLRPTHQRSRAVADRTALWVDLGRLARQPQQLAREGALAPPAQRGRGERERRGGGSRRSLRHRHHARPRVCGCDCVGARRGRRRRRKECARPGGGGDARPRSLRGAGGVRRGGAAGVLAGVTQWRHAAGARFLGG
mmetsp:Transcript_4263/g.14465  ORF Transcript_4263/g.14465 Transcript_4263/m.14465 type:complete len:266 (-) Transcript_4263:56-853(-)